MFENEEAAPWLRAEIAAARAAFATAGLSDEEATDVFHKALLDVLHRAPARPEIVFRQLIERGIAASLEVRGAETSPTETDSSTA